MMSITVKKNKSIKCINIDNLKKILMFFGDYQKYDGVLIKEKDGIPVECSCLTILDKPKSLEEGDDGCIIIKGSTSELCLSSIDYDNQTDFMILSFAPRLSGEVLYYELPKAVREQIKKVSPSSRRFLDVPYEQKIEISKESLKSDSSRKNLEIYLECNFDEIEVYETEKYSKKYKTEDIVCFEIEGGKSICCASKQVTLQKPYVFINYKESSTNKLAILFSENEKKVHQ